MWKIRFTRGNIIYILVLALLWLLWQIFIDELVGLLRNQIAEGGMVMYSVTHPYIIMPAILVICLLYLYLYFKRGKRQEENQIDNCLSEITGNPTQLLNQYAKAEIRATIPGTPLTPTVNIYRASYIKGNLPTLRVDYIASSTEVLASFEREAKIRIQRGDSYADILPATLKPNVSGTVSNTADYTLPPEYQGGGNYGNSHSYLV